MDWTTHQEEPPGLQCWPELGSLVGSRQPAEVNDGNGLRHVSGEEQGPRSRTILLLQHELGRWLHHACGQFLHWGWHPPWLVSHYIGVLADRWRLLLSCAQLKVGWEALQQLLEVSYIYSICSGIGAALHLQYAALVMVWLVLVSEFHARCQTCRVTTEEDPCFPFRKD